MANFRVMERGVAREKHRGIALEESRAAAMPPRGLPAPEKGEARDAFLTALRSNGRYKYSRYNGLPLGRERRRQKMAHLPPPYPPRSVRSSPERRVTLRSSIASKSASVYLRDVPKRSRASATVALPLARSKAATSPSRRA